MWDPAVPSYHERALLDAVIRAGRTEFLRQNTAVAFNHCGFGTAEIISNFDQLVAWVGSIEN